MALTLEQIRSETWALGQSALEELVATVSNREKGAQISADAAALFGEKDRPTMFRVEDRAVIEVRGVILRGRSDAFLNFFGVTNTGMDDIHAAIQAAEADPTVSELVFLVDSPGGVAPGLDALSQAVKDAEKPSVAVVTGMAASAAYWLASSADRIVAERDAMVGSIGVFSVLVDSSGAAEAQGYRVHMIRSGPLKGTGTAGVAISEEELAAVQKRVDGLAELFVGRVAEGRGLPRARADRLATGEAWLASEALDLELVDELGTFTAALRGSNEQEAPVASENENAAPEAAPKPATIKELRAAYGDESEFCLEQLEAEATLDQAELAYTRLKAQQAEQRAEAAEKKAEELEAKLAEQPKPAPRGGGVDPETLASEGSPADERPQADFMARARAKAEAEGIRLTEAMSGLAREEPELHADFVKNTSRR